MRRKTDENLSRKELVLLLGKVRGMHICKNIDREDDQEMNLNVRLFQEHLNKDIACSTKVACLKF